MRYFGSTRLALFELASRVEKSCMDRAASRLSSLPSFQIKYSEHPAYTYLPLRLSSLTRSLRAGNRSPKRPLFLSLPPLLPLFSFALLRCRRCSLTRASLTTAAPAISLFLVFRRPSPLPSSNHYHHLSSPLSSL